MEPLREDHKDQAVKWPRISLSFEWGPPWSSVGGAALAARDDVDDRREQRRVFSHAHHGEAAADVARQGVVALFSEEGVDGGAGGAAGVTQA